MPELREKYGVEEIGIFGSFSRDKGSVNSDLDLIVNYRKRPQGWDYFSLGNYLEEVFEPKVDIVEPDFLIYQIKEKVLQEVKYI